MTGSPEGGFVARRLALIGGALAVFLAARLYAPWVAVGPVVCPLHGLIGLPCPSCGLTRAMCALVTGEWASAAGFNALVYPLALLMGGGALVAALEIVTGRPSAARRPFFSTRVALALGALVVGYHLWRTAAMIHDGSLARDYLATSWTWGFLGRIFG
jgi:hypothetical protein